MSSSLKQVRSWPGALALNWRPSSLALITNDGTDPGTLTPCRERTYLGLRLSSASRMPSMR